MKLVAQYSFISEETRLFIVTRTERHSILVVEGGSNGDRSFSEF